MACSVQRVTGDNEQLATWHAWLQSLLETPEGIRARETIERLLASHSLPTANEAYGVASELGVSGVVALRAAGHHEAADGVEGKYGDGQAQARESDAPPLPPRPDVRYGGGMTAEGAGEPESDLDRILGAIQELVRYTDERFTRVDAAVASLAGVASSTRRELAALRDEVEENAVLANTALAQTRRDLAVVREEVLGVKVDVAQSESRQTKATARQVARHNQDRDAHGGHAGAA